MSIKATAVWTSATAGQTVLTQSVEDTTSVLLTMIISGTITAGQINFEASDDGINWYSLPGLVQATFSIFTFWQPSFGSPVALQFNVAGFTQYRARLSTVLTGTGNVTVNITNEVSPFLVLVSAVQQNGPNNHMVIDDSAGGGVTANVTVKGTQGTNGLAVQHFHDAGRAAKVFTASFTSTAAAETSISFQVSTDGGALSGAATSYTVTAGKKFRILGITAQMRAGGTTPAASTATLKMKIGGVLQGMPYQVACPTVTTATAANFPGMVVLADGWELPAASVISFTLTLTAFTVTTNTPIIDIGLIGYEY